MCDKTIIYVKSRAMSRNRQNHAQFQEPEGLKKDVYAIVLSIAPVHWIFTRTVLGV